MKLYHGTSEQGYHRILKSRAIRPRNHRKSLWDKYPSRKNLVYLTSAYPFYYSACASQSTFLNVFEIDVDKLDSSRFYPDEDAIAQGLRGSKGEVTFEDLPAAHKYVNANFEKFQHLWQWSLDYLGNLTYKGEIPLTYVTRICRVDLKQRSAPLRMLIIDPCISLINFTYVSHKYLSLRDWFFGDSPSILSKQDREIDKQMELNDVIQFWDTEAANREHIQIIDMRTQSGQVLDGETYKTPVNLLSTS
jgi:hypothetical protein